jgi:hypothetical protein
MYAQPALVIDGKLSPYLQKKGLSHHRHNHAHDWYLEESVGKRQSHQPNRGLNRGMQHPTMTEEHKMQHPTMTGGAQGASEAPVPFHAACRGK